MIKHEISQVAKGSIAARMGIIPGDFLLAINGEEVRDILDYRFRTQEVSLLVEVEKPHGEIWELDIEKDPDRDLGMTFKQSLMSGTKRCANHCVFCFIDQQPKGLRQSLYVKDDDPRLSFLLGNYVTLTNLGEKEIRRLAGYHLSPLRISIHAADLDLRAKMMGTEKARNLFDALDIFKAHHIEMHFQIVLCKGLNDKEALNHTIQKLQEYMPQAKSLAIVPAGLTGHREGLHPLEPFEKADAAQVIAQVNAVAGDKPFVYLSDEWYILAQLPLPAYEAYGNFPQLDNGVGVLRLFQHQFATALKKSKSTRKVNTVGIITATGSGQFMKNIAKNYMKYNPGTNIHVYTVRNNFFGETVTVSGLLTGQDIMQQLKNRSKPDLYFLPENAFRAGVKGRIMLDGMTLEQLQKALGTKVLVGSTHGAKFCRQLDGACAR